MESPDSGMKSKQVKMTEANERKAQTHNRGDDDRGRAVAQENTAEITLLPLGTPAYGDGLSFRNARKPVWPATCRGYCRR